MIEVLIAFFIGMFLLYLGLRDIKKRDVKDKHLVYLFIISIVISSLTAPLFLTLLSVGLMFLVCLALFKLGMGGGDLKLMLILTIMLNIKAFYILFIAGLIYLLLNITKKETRPFVPYIFLAYVIVLSLYFLGVV